MPHSFSTADGQLQTDQNAKGTAIGYGSIDCKSANRRSIDHGLISYRSVWWKRCRNCRKKGA